MSSFRNSIDIANRACQHMGVRKISPTLGFNDDTVQAQEIGDCYDKLRVAELRRNVWRFSTRRAVIRAIDTNSMFLQPELWQSGKTYRPGAVVATVDGQLWFSTSKNNINNPPGGSMLWDGYFGAMTCDPWSSKEAYLAGDIVYKVEPNGTYLVYLSLANSNSDDPEAVQDWVATANGETRYYASGDVVSYSNVLYQSRINLNGNNTPGLAPAVWVSATVYADGAQVTGSDAVVYTSTQAGNTAHDPVTDDGTYWTQGGLSTQADWAALTVYGINALAVGADGTIYRSVQAGNTGNDPTTDDGTYWVTTGALSPWTTVVTNTTGSRLWAQLDVALDNVLFAYPLGCGPIAQSGSKNVFRLPAGFLREAPQVPKQGPGFLGGPNGNAYNDWVYEGDYLISNDGRAIVFRFVANIHNVATMDPMFCEGLGARIALECCERVTQSDGKIGTIGAAYTKFMGDARAVNGIETGPVDPPEDELISCRL